MWVEVRDPSDCPDWAKALNRSPSIVFIIRTYVRDALVAAKMPDRNCISLMGIKQPWSTKLQESRVFPLLTKASHRTLWPSTRMLVLPSKRIFPDSFQSPFHIAYFVFSCVVFAGLKPSNTHISSTNIFLHGHKCNKSGMHGFKWVLICDSVAASLLSKQRISCVGCNIT